MNKEQFKQLEKDQFAFHNFMANAISIMLNYVKKYKLCIYT